MKYNKDCEDTVCEDCPYYWICVKEEFGKGEFEELK